MLSSGQEQATQPSHASFLFSFGVSVALFGLFANSIRFWGAHGRLLASSWHLPIAIGLACVGLSFVWSRLQRTKLQLQVLPFALTLLLLFFSDWLTRRFNLLQGPLIRGEIILLSLLLFPLLRSRTFSLLLRVLPICSALLLFSLFLIESNGRLISSDDHPTFLYRLLLLKENFPFIPFYGPMWNAGVDVRDFFATGAFNVFFLFSPLIYFSDLTQTYNHLIALLLFAFPPCMLYCAARFEGLPSPAPAIAATLSLSASLAWYRWGLGFGTVGFITTCALVPFNLALASRLLSKNGPLRWRDTLLFIASFTLMLFWTPSGLVFIPAIGFGIITLPRLFRLRPRPLMLMTLVLLAVNLSWIGIFWSVASVSSFLDTSKPSYQMMHDSGSATAPKNEYAGRVYKAESKPINLRKGLRKLREAATSMQPLLFLFVLPGLFFLPRRSRWLYAATYCWLLLLGTVVVSLKPQLELDRMLLILVICCCVPAAAALAELFRPDKLASLLSSRAILSALACGFLVAGILSAASVVRNRSFVPYYFESPLKKDIISAIQAHHYDGRILFSGFILHHLNHGHIAPLVSYTKVPLVASSHVHNLWKYRQVFPRSFIGRGIPGIEEYMDLYNVTAFFAHEKSWRDRFLKHRDRYTLLAKYKNFFLFRRNAYTSNYFLEGSGVITSQSSNAITLRIDSEEAVLKFHYLPFLKSSACEISGTRVAPEIDFIKLSGCVPGETLRIESKNVFARVFS